ncbi:MAG TPA: DUF892 family protein [Polyangia bacterium]|jgi:ferritin-like metal-binding protein YciE
MQNAREFFVHELADMYDAEHKVISELDEQIRESSRPDVQKAFTQHKAQTERQVQRVEQCFSEIGQQPEACECAGIRGLVDEHEHFKQEQPSKDLLDLFNVDAAMKVEHYEIAAYESLTRLAQDLGYGKSYKLLSQNMKEEQQMLKKMEGLSKRVKPAQLGIEDTTIGARSQSHGVSTRTSTPRSR